MSHTNNFVNFRVGGREFVVQTIRKQGEENKELGVIFTDGAQSWAATVTPALKPRTVCEDDGRFLSSVQDAIFSQNDKKFAFEVSDTGDRLSLTIKSKAKADVAVNYCKVDMSACEDHADTVRSMLSTIILKVRASQDDCEAQKAKNESLRKDLATATAAATKAVDATKMSEGILLGKFVAVLNSKKEEIARLRRDVAQLTEKLAAERARAGPATGSPAAAIPEALPVNHEEETDDGSDVTDSEDEEDEIVSAVRPPVESLPLASLEPHYDPPKRGAHGVRGQPAPVISSPASTQGAASLPTTVGATPRPSVSSRQKSTPLEDLMDAALEEDGFGERRQGVPVSARRSVKRPAPSAEEDLSQTTVASNQSGKSQSLKDSRTENSFE